MKTELLIELYHTQEDAFLREINISNYDLRILNKIVPPDPEDDFEYCNSAFIEKDEFEKLRAYVKELSDLQYEDFIYNIITRSI
jgi:hypothetical protein